MESYVTQDFNARGNMERVGNVLQIWHSILMNFYLFLIFLKGTLAIEHSGQNELILVEAGCVCLKLSIIKKGKGSRDQDK